MMRFAVACVAALALVACVAASVSEREGHQHDLRVRLGHFKEKPFIDLYKTYAAAFVLPLHKERAKDDYRNYMPSVDECVVFLRKFRIDTFKLREIDELVVMDACLGYLYDNANKALDDERDELKQLENIEQLRNLFENTKISALNEDGKECVADLLLNVIVAKNQYSDVVCNNHWLQVFLQFAECQSSIPSEARESDSYLSALYELVRERVHTCVDFEIGHIEEAVRKAYARQLSTRFGNTLRSKLGSSMAREQKSRMWPKEVITLLAAVQNTRDEVNAREVHQLIRGVITSDEQLKAVLLANLADYADKAIKPKADSKANRADPSGMSRYTALVDSMCNFFRSSDQESVYDFATPIIRLVQLLAYEDLFGISQVEFVRKILAQGHETTPIYLSVQACNILTYTEGALSGRTANAKQHYAVVFKPDTSGMILWPDAGYY